MIDYPGKLSCVLFLSGCNFNCPYCHNPDLAKGCSDYSAFLEENAVYNFLETRRNFLDGVVISGGEPTLKEELVSICKKIKQTTGYPIKLDTNGSRPQVIKHLISEGLVDYIAMDIKTDPLHYPLFIKKDYNPDEILESIRIIMKSDLNYEFRTTCVKPIVDEQVLENIARLIQGAMLYVIQAFHKVEVLQPEFFVDSGTLYSNDELMELKSVVEPWVNKCIVR